MGYEENRQRRARKLYARRIREEERRRREEEERRQRDQRAEEHRRQMAQERQQREEEQKKAAREKAEEQRKAAQQHAENHRRQMAQQKQQQSAAISDGGRPGAGQTKPAQAVPSKTAPKSANTFYTNKPDNGIIEPRFGSVTAYEDEIKKQQKAVDALHKQQFNLMLKNDVAGMAALDEPIKNAEAEIDDLKREMYSGMGAYEHGKRATSCWMTKSGAAMSRKRISVRRIRGTCRPRGTL